MSVISPGSKTAIIVFNLGGPDKPESVQPFLFNLFNDKAILGVPDPIRWCLAKLISSRRAPIAQEIYGHIGGKSPIVENTQVQCDALQNILSDYGQVKVFQCMRYWHPMSDEVAQKVKDYAPDHIILLPLYPQFSTTTTGSSVKDWQRAAKAVKLTAPTTTLCCYPMQENFITSQAELIANYYTQAKSESGKEPRILFSAHGLPEKIVKAGDPYQKQVEATTQAVIESLFSLNPESRILNPDYINCYQSRVGPLKWIGPSTEDEIARAGKDGVPVVLVPIAFVSEHSETLVELDIEYKELADEHKVETYIRVPTVSADSYFIEGLKQLCLSVRQAGHYCPWEDGLQCITQEQMTGVLIGNH